MHGVGAWRADASAHRLVHKEFPDAVVVFDPLSGSTVMLSDLCWFVLTELVRAGAACDTAALLHQVCEAAGGADTSNAPALLDDALASLAAAGLIHAEAP